MDEIEGMTSAMLDAVRTGRLSGAEQRKADMFDKLYFIYQGDSATLPIRKSSEQATWQDALKQQHRVDSEYRLDQLTPNRLLANISDALHFQFGPLEANPSASISRVNPLSLTQLSRINSSCPHRSHHRTLIMENMIRLIIVDDSPRRTPWTTRFVGDTTWNRSGWGRQTTAMMLSVW